MKIAESMTMTFSPVDDLNVEARNQDRRLAELYLSVNYRSNLKNNNFWILSIIIPRNVTGLLMLTSEVNPENFRLIS